MSCGSLERSPAIRHFFTYFLLKRFNLTDKEEERKRNGTSQSTKDESSTVKNQDKSILVFPVVVSIVSANVLNSSQQVVKELQTKNYRHFQEKDKEVPVKPPSTPTCLRYKPRVEAVSIPQSGILQQHLSVTPCRQGQRKVFRIRDDTKVAASLHNNNGRLVQQKERAESSSSQEHNTASSLQMEADRHRQKNGLASPVTGRPGIPNKPADNSLTDSVAMGTNHKAQPGTPALSRGENVVQQSPVLQRGGAEV